MYTNGKKYYYRQYRNPTIAFESNEDINILSHLPSEKKLKNIEDKPAENLTWVVKLNHETVYPEFRFIALVLVQKPLSL